MKKEEKTDMLTAWLAEVIAEKEEAPHDESCAVIFLSADEVQMSGTADGCVPTNKVYSDNPLKAAVRTIVGCYYEDEEKHWLETVATEHPERSDYVQEHYDPALCPDHVYHSLRTLKALVSDN